MSAPSAVSVSDAVVLETLTMRGFADFRSSGRNACVTVTTPNTLTSNRSRRSVTVVSAAGAPLKIPALLTRTSRRPWVSCTCSTAALTLSGSVTSSWIAVTGPPAPASLLASSAGAPRPPARGPAPPPPPAVEVPAAEHDGQAPAGELACGLLAQPLVAARHQHELAHDASPNVWQYIATVLSDLANSIQGTGQPGGQLGGAPVVDYQRRHG